MSETFLLETEAAEFLRISRRTLERWRIQGTGPIFRKHGRRVVYARDDLLKWTDNRKANSTSSH